MRLTHFVTARAPLSRAAGNTGPILSLDSPHWNRRQSYTVSKVNSRGGITQLGSGLACPPCNIGPLSTPAYPALAGAAVHNLGGVKVFAGQRAEGFYVDLGSIFDLANLRPFEQPPGRSPRYRPRGIGDPERR